jgi:hypothetical protein
MLESLLSSISYAGIVESLWPLALFSAGLIVYFVFIFEFYEFISRRDPFRIVENPREPLEHIGYTLEYVFLFPLVTLVWFLVLSTFLSMISSSVSIENAFLISMALTVAMRVTAYVNEKLSVEVARLVPLTLMAILIVEFSSLSLVAPLCG